MKHIVRKIAAGVLAVLLAASLCGCDRGYIMTVDGVDIRNGVYLTHMQTAYGNAMNEYSEENPDADDEDDDTPITEKTIDGKSGSEWIKDATLKAVRRFVAIKRKCEEFGIELTDEELRDINTSVNQTWENDSQLVQLFYGYNTFGEYYESLGIGKDSMREISQVSKLQNKLFLYYYDKGGPLEVPESDIDDYIVENYAAAKILTLSYTDASGASLKEDADKKAVKDEAADIAKRINGGASAVDEFYKYNLRRAQESAKAEAESSYDADNADGLSKDEWIKQEVDDVDVVKAEKPDALDIVVPKDSTDYDSKAVEHIFSAAADGKAVVIDGDSASYVIIKSDILGQAEWKESSRESVLSQLKGEDYQSMMDLIGDKYEVKADSYLVNKKYAPETLNS